jgi:hypothetical protein
MDLQVSDEETNVMKFLMEDSDNEADLLAYIEEAGGIEWCRNFRIDQSVYPLLVVDGGTLLHQCLFHTSCVRMNLLIQLGVEVDEKDSMGCTVLHHLCGKSLLFERGLDGAPETFEYREVVDEKIRALIEHGANLEIRDPSNCTALIRALQGGWTTRPTVVDTLLEFNADVTAEDSDGMTALHFASLGNNGDILKRLLDLDILNIDQTCKEDGTTPLHWADLETLPVLLRAGADMTIKDEQDGHTPIENWLEQYSWSAYEAQLQEEGVAQNQEDGVEFRNWVDQMEEIWDLEIESRRNECKAFLMGGQKRLGEKSLLYKLDPEILRMILDSTGRIPPGQHAGYER